MAKSKLKQTLLPHEIRELRSMLHHLKPVVIIGQNGLSSAVVLETDRALTDHELIKIRLNIEDREVRTKIATEICEKTKAALIQTIGHIIAIYRKNPQTE
ncbi:MAG: ribosome assembly RNA-binding protein YhbY [Gammaproteobacteria bacterium]|nr:ribosome assembly RNA-binding protein YhbY [Gammaproteobacteria bacterium]